MEINGFVIVAVVTYLIMTSAFFLSHIRFVHMPIMISIMVFDLCVPFYLFLNRDWKARLIDTGDILSFGVWMHFGLVLTLYILYAVQIQSAVKILKDDTSSREDHNGQGKVLLGLRAMVIFTGALLIDPELAELESGGMSIE